MRKIVVDNKFNNKKIDVFLKEIFPNLNKNVIFKALRKKDIRVNDIKISENVLVSAGDEITLYITDNLLSGIDSLETIYDDKNIVVINKPAGIPVTDNSNAIITLTTLVKSQFGNELEPCHRLDQNTTGLIIYAKNESALQIMLEKFEKHEIEKHYTALVSGKMPKKHDILEAYLFKDSKKSLVYISDTPKTGYSKIITKYTLLSEDSQNHTSLLDVVIPTGKTHQIRAHLAHIGHPIIGDGKYGDNQLNKKLGKKYQELRSSKIKFCFTTNSGILEYLNNVEIQ